MMQKSKRRMFGGFVCPVSMAEACVVVSLFLGASVEAGPVVGGFSENGENDQGFTEYTHSQTGMVFVLLPESSFLMGSPEGQGAHYEHPQHVVRLDAFLIAKHEVTQAQYRDVLTGNAVGLNADPSGFSGDELPVESISWDDLTKFGGFLDETGLSLPTEAQWEYACRGGTTTEWSFADRDSVAGLAGDYMVYADGSTNSTASVGSKLPNPFGLHDMHGNVYEWCRDLADNDFYSRDGATLRNPESKQGQSGKRVLRGGSWRNNLQDYNLPTRSATRQVSLLPSQGNSSLGFRPVLQGPFTDPDEEAEPITPVVHYSFDDPGDLGGDSSPRSYVYTDATLVEPSGVSPEAKFGAGALALVNAAGDTGENYLRLPNIRGLFTDAATLAMWVKLEEETSGEAELTGFASLGSTDTQLSVYPWTNGFAYFSTFRKNRLNKITLLAGVQRTEWHHLAITSDPVEGWKLYQNGELVSLPVQANTALFIPLVPRIGSSRRNAGDPRLLLNGCLDEVFFFNEALTQEQIKNLVSFNQTTEPVVGEETTTIEVDGSKWNYLNSRYQVDRVKNYGHTASSRANSTTRFPIFGGFDLSGVKSKVHTATLTLIMNNYEFEDSRPFTIGRITQEWTEYGSNWETYDGSNPWAQAGGGGDYTLEEGVAGSVGPTARYESFTVDVTAMVQKWVDEPSTNLGMIFFNAGSEYVLRSTQNGIGERPYRLTITSSGEEQPSSAFTVTVEHYNLDQLEFRIDGVFDTDTVGADAGDLGLKFNPSPDPNVHTELFLTGDTYDLNVDVTFTPPGGGDPVLAYFVQGQNDSPGGLGYRDAVVIRNTQESGIIAAGTVVSGVVSLNVEDLFDPAESPASQFGLVSGRDDASPFRWQRIESTTVVFVPDETPPDVTIDGLQSEQVIATSALEPCVDDDGIEFDDCIVVNVKVVDDSSTNVTFSSGAEESVAFTRERNLPAGGARVETATPLLSEGENILAVNALDAAGNPSGTTITVIRDTENPVVTITPPAGTTVGLTPQTINIVVEDATRTTTTLEGIQNDFELDPPQGEFDVAVDLVEGENTVSVTTVDAAGNTNSVEYSLVLDLSAPVVKILSPSGEELCLGASDPNPVPVTVSVDDLSETEVTSEPSGVSESLPPGGALVTGSILLQEGENTLTVSATDILQNHSSDSIKLILDTTAPEVEIVSPDIDQVVRETIDFDVEAADILPGSGVKQVALFIDDSEVPVATLIEDQFEHDLDTLVLTDGPHTLKAVATDGKDNSAADIIDIVVDNTPPTVTIITPTEQGFVSGEFPFTVEAADGGAGLASVTLLAGGEAPTFDPSGLLTGETSVTLEAREDSRSRPDGPLLLTAEAVDLAGNEVTTTVTVIVDNTVPAKTIVTPNEGERVSGFIEISAVVEDANLDFIEIEVDGVSQGTSSTSPFSIEFDTTERLDGALSITVVAQDLAGNADTCNREVTVDNICVFIHPTVLNLRSKSKRWRSRHSWWRHRAVTVILRGPNLGLLLPTEESGLELCVPGGNSVPVATGLVWDDAILDWNRDGIGALFTKFDREALIASIRAGISGGQIEANSRVVLTLKAGDGLVVGKRTIRIKERSRRRHRHGRGRR